jgi:hypothetical protein
VTINTVRYEAAVPRNPRGNIRFEVAAALTDDMLTWFSSGFRKQARKG